MDNLPNIPGTNITKSNKRKLLRVGIPAAFIVIVGGMLLVIFGVIKLPSGSIPLVSQGPKVELKTEYKNPFAKKTQFVNPFAEFKNPFVTNR